MSSEAQILANRCNAQKSTGPQTQEGKNAISQNAVKHGLSARQDVIRSGPPMEKPATKPCSPGNYDLILQNKANLKTEDRKQKTEDSKIRAKSTPKLRLSVPPSRTNLSSVALMD